MHAITCMFPDSAPRFQACRSADPAGRIKGGIGLKTNSDVTLIQRKITLVAGFSMPSTSENNLKCELFPG